MRLDAGIHERVLLPAQLGVQGLDVSEHKDDRAGCAVTMVRGKVQDDRPARDLHEGRGVLTAFLPVKFAPEVIEVEALGCLDVVHP
jgi:hypothetical protein